MKYYIIAGEASGDLHASNLMKSLYKHDSSAEIRFWGGDLMKKVGGTLVKHYRDLAFMGFWEVITNLPTIVKNLKFCKEDIKKFEPDAIIFIDYPGFNMRIAEWAKQRNIPTHYYISPQIWAWKESRIKAIKRDFDFLYVILPFEKDFYEKKHKFPVNFVGHPLIDAIKTAKIPSEEKFRQNNQLGAKPIIALLPGSRKQEINKMLTEMLGVANDFPDYQFIIAGAPGQSRAFYSPFLINKNVGFVQNQTYALLQFSYAALVTSGTATLETALFKVPEVVLYKGNWASYQIAKRIITLKYISLVNLIMDQELVTELIQEKCNSKNIKTELTKILDPECRKKMINQYQILEKNLGGAGASEKVAKLIIEKTVSKK
jgi:lipid-A-disaccharide synthase